MNLAKMPLPELRAAIVDALARLPIAKLGAIVDVIDGRASVHASVTPLTLTPTFGMAAAENRGATPRELLALVRDRERRIVIDVLRARGGNVSSAARDLGLDRKKMERIARNMEDGKPWRL